MKFVGVFIGKCSIDFWITVFAIFYSEHDLKQIFNKY